MSLSTARTAYMNTAVTTANPSSLLVMLFDRLVLDLAQAEAAASIAGQLPLEARRHLRHAQDIVIELRGSLDTDGFAGAVQLGALYDYLLRRLIHASVAQDVEAVAECRSISSELAATWREAAVIAATP